MRVLVCTTFALNTPHFETELEIIQKHLAAGDHVSVVGCNGELLACDVNWEHRYSDCVACMGRRRDGLGRLSLGVPLLPRNLTGREWDVLAKYAKP